MDKERAKDIIAYRCAQELKDGYVVNLGIGIPTRCARFFPEGVDIVRQNFGFDLESGVTEVALDPEAEHYYLEVRPLE